MSEMTYMETLARWQELQDTIARLKDEERALREGIFQGTFPDPKEGTNKVELPDGRTLKAVHKFYYNVIEDEFQNLDIPPSLRKKLFREKHELRITPYRQLDDEDKVKVGKALNIKPGLPTLEIIEPKTPAPDVEP